MTDRTAKQPKVILSEFKKILKEASALFDRPESEISQLQFGVASNGRIGARSIMKLGGWNKLKDYVAPTTGKANKDTIAMLERILGK